MSASWFSLNENRTAWISWCSLGDTFADSRCNPSFVKHMNSLATVTYGLAATCSTSKVGFSSLHPDGVPPVARRYKGWVKKPPRDQEQKHGKKASDGFSKLVVWTMFKLCSCVFVRFIVHLFDWNWSMTTVPLILICVRPIWDLDCRVSFFDRMDAAYGCIWMHMVFRFIFVVYNIYVCVNLKISGPQILDHFVALPPSPQQKKIRLLYITYS